MNKVSIIVPIYKTPIKYLKHCVESLLNQEYSNLDIILVDDGSEMEEIALYISEIDDPRISFIGKENGGVSSARNAGILQAKGDYIAFVDPDDWVDEGFINQLVENMEKEEADLSIVSFQYEYSDDCRNRADYKVESQFIQVIQGENTWKELLHSAKIGGFLCNKLFKKEFITQLLDEKLHYSEDFVFTAEYCRIVKKAVFQDAKLYHYRQGQGNATSNFSFNKKIMTLLDSYQKLEGIYGECASAELDSVVKNTLKIALNLRARIRLNKIRDSASRKRINTVIEQRMYRVLLSKKISVPEKANIILTWLFPTAMFRIKNRVLGRKI